MRDDTGDRPVTQAGSTSPLASEGTARVHRTGRIRTIVVGSLLTGVVVAAVLTMVVFGGAAEPVIVGSALLGFGLGWALLAVLSIRLTDQPQRWAVVPAAVMGTTGLALIALTPGDRGMTAAGWVWPLVMLALAVWIGVQARRSLRARSGRWAIYPIVVLMTVAALGGMVETVALATDERLDDAPGQRYDVGGRRLHLACTGSGGPTVVLLSGQSEISAHWGLIAPAVGRTTRVCAYDRAGQAWSDDVPQAQDAQEIAADLHTLLDVAGERGPYVLAGHSIGGPLAMAYAARYPEQVAGVALLDATNPYEVPADTPLRPSNPGPVALLPPLARLGVGRFTPSSETDLPQTAAEQTEAFGASPRGYRNFRDDFATTSGLLAQAQTLTTLDGKPLVVLTSTGGTHPEGFTEAHDRMAALSSTSSHRFTDATHEGVLVDAAGAEASTRAITDVVQAIRTGSPLPAD
jgi:pimeloyl-ACP methyl ester carboxylesterase